MTFLIVSFIAGVLTVLAPCVLPLLPVVIGSSATGRSSWTPYIVVGSLAVSIILFTYLLKASTAFIMIPPEFWTYLSGGILMIFGLTLLFPSLWENVPGLSKLSTDSNKLLGKGIKQQSFWGDALVGAALGPVFSTCSPTYFVILASVLPASFALGTLYLLSYTFGLSLILLMLALLGEKLAERLSGFADPKGWFKRGLGVLFVLLGLMIATGVEKKVELAILESGIFDVTKVAIMSPRRTKRTPSPRLKQPFGSAKPLSRSANFSPRSASIRSISERPNV
jgi:cytochrome c biogenesis protein CcdA